jgi:hypothetical protein
MSPYYMWHGQSRLRLPWKLLVDGAVHKQKLNLCMGKVVKCIEKTMWHHHSGLSIPEAS